MLHLIIFSLFTVQRLFILLRLHPVLLKDTEDCFFCLGATDALALQMKDHWSINILICILDNTVLLRGCLYYRFHNVNWTLYTHFSRKTDLRIIFQILNCCHLWFSLMYQAAVNLLKTSSVSWDFSASAHGASFTNATVAVWVFVTIASTGKH